MENNTLLNDNWLTEIIKMEILKSPKSVKSESCLASLKHLQSYLTKTDNKQQDMTQQPSALHGTHFIQPWGAVKFPFKNLKKKILALKARTYARRSQRKMNDKTFSEEKIL